MDADRTIERPRPRRGDARGALFVIAVALGALLVAAIAELAALSDATRAREAAQAAVDASALENAIWHARGMNTVASLNIVMGLAVGVLVLWRLVLAASALASLTLVALPFAAGPLPDASAHAASAGPASPPLARLLGADVSIEQRVRQVVTGLAAAQAAVAAYTPLLAARSATAFAGSEGRRLEMFSASRWIEADASELAASSSARAAAPGNTALTGSAGRLASPDSLPLERDRVSLLCARPVSDWESRTVAAAERLLPTSVAAGWRDATARPIQPRALAALGIRERGSPSAIATRIAGLADTLAPRVFCAPVGPVFARFGAALGPLAGSPLDGAPTRVWGPARNGNVYLRSAARLSDAGASARGSRVEASLLAHAEMYFDCDDRWERCAPDAAWQPRWRARLRRVQPLSTLLAAAHDDARAWRPGRELPPVEPESLAGTLSVPLVTRRALPGVDPFVPALSHALRFIH